MSTPLDVIHKSRFTNIFHCCVQRTGSQWIRAILSDPRIYPYSGLRFYPPDSYWLEFLGRTPEWRLYSDRLMVERFPEDTIVGPLYLGAREMRFVPKPAASFCLAIIRDPRDVLVSDYFSITRSHANLGEAVARRNVLRGLDVQRGLLHLIESFAVEGMFEALRSWGAGPSRGPGWAVVRFEDLIGPQADVLFADLFSLMDIPLPRTEQTSLLADFSFERLSGRPRGVPNEASHYRKGVAGDWRNYFTPEIERRFFDVTGDLLTQMGYL